MMSYLEDDILGLYVLVTLSALREHWSFITYPHLWLISHGYDLVQLSPQFSTCFLAYHIPTFVSPNSNLGPLMFAVQSHRSCQAARRNRPVGDMIGEERGDRIKQPMWGSSRVWGRHLNSWGYHQQD